MIGSREGERHLCFQGLGTQQGGGLGCPVRGELRVAGVLPSAGEGCSATGRPRSAES